MTNPGIEDLNIVSLTPLMTPDELKAQLPISEEALTSVRSGREQINKILSREDSRLFVVVGPCSIHDVDAAKEYAEKLKAFSEEVSDTMLLVMRVYFEKPRTTTGWKGLINDPHIDGSFRIEKGLNMGRQLLLEIAEMGLPIATEALDPISPQYTHDLISWTAIGARTTESQTHREMASGLSSTIGFKNGTDGSLSVAINALKSATTPHRFLGIDHNGQVALIHTKGNRNADIVLRGGNLGPNYSAKHIARCEEELEKAGVSKNIVVDCSHANSNKQHGMQPEVMNDLAQQINDGNTSIVGVMIESHLKEGNQKIPDDLSQLEYGVSITDACLGWEDTKAALKAMHEKIKAVMPKRQAGRHS